ncbi:MAG: hypothetical protein K8S62_11615 [Candidatus Sabulitectum sp.]|nr:hypothetical protein [Candidatus Sabulitectum sp.]
MANENGVTKGIRRAARIASAITVSLILVLFIGDGLSEGFQPMLHLTLRETLMMISFFAVWLGLILGWKRELTGGLLTVCGFAAFYLLDYLFSGSFPRGPFFLLLASPGLLYLYCGIKCRKPRKD